MKFDNTPKDGGSYEKPKPGKYIGLLVGFAYCGTQPGGQYGPKPKVMLRWELHKRRGPSLDNKNFIHTLTQTFGATVRGDQSLLKKCLEAHGIPMAEGASTDSQGWLGRCAWLDVEWSADEKYANVTGISRLDPDDDECPEKQLNFEHWEGQDDGTPPQWAAWAIGRSTDLAHLAPPRPAKPGGNGTPAAAATAVGVPIDDDDIPF